MYKQISSSLSRVLVIILATAITIGFSTSCTSRKHLVYMKNIEREREVKTHTSVTVDYKLAPGDVIYVKILSNNKEMSELFNPSDMNFTPYGGYSSAISYLKGFKINDSGNVSLPIMRSVAVAGLTMDEAEQKIQKKVNEYLNNTTVMVRLLSFTINIMGEVNSPGAKEIYKDKLNILEALARAGDIRETGDKKNIMILRTVNGETLTYTIDLTDANILSSEQYTVMPNDIIIVQPLRQHSLRISMPTISVVLSALTVVLLTINVFYSRK